MNIEAVNAALRADRGKFIAETLKITRRIHEREQRRANTAELERLFVAAKRASAICAYHAAEFNRAYG